MSEFADRLIKLKEECLRCWAAEYGDISPQTENTKIASAELRFHGNPDCVCGGKARLRFSPLTNHSLF